MSLHFIVYKSKPRVGDRMLKLTVLRGSMRSILQYPPIHSKIPHLWSHFYPCTDHLDLCSEFSEQLGGKSIRHMLK
jgi:hypothetical protein